MFIWTIGEKTKSKQSGNKLIRNRLRRHILKINKIMKNLEQLMLSKAKTNETALCHAAIVAIYLASVDVT